VLGVASVIVMLSVGEAALSGNEAARGLGGSTIVLRSADPSMSLRSRKDGPLGYGLTYGDCPDSRDRSTVTSATPMRDAARRCVFATG
jgi:hypothetical protein